ncbi:DUF4129 domain-containing protein [Cellulomonas sp. NPDC057328]|uniref:DUF4129 domain-containing protein n=1 Tax=Cellulomonas sp. NPDC057328 TaxID=3346101 RepID=UPI003640673E
MPTTQRTPRPEVPPPARPAAPAGPDRAVASARDRAVVLTAAAAVLVVVAVLAGALAGPVQLGGRQVEPPDLPTFSAPPPPSPPPAGVDRPVTEPGDPPAWLRTVTVVLVVLAVAAVLALVARWLRRRRWWTPPPPGDADAPGTAADVGDMQVVAAMRAGVRSASRALADDVPPGDAVVAAWVAVEEAAASTGVVRDRAQTATEFTLDVLDRTRADPDATRALLALYLTARFGAHPVTAADVRRARELLDVVGTGLARRADAAGEQEAGGDGRAGTAPPADPGGTP